ncbi:uncharacterized protein LOC133448900 isoform X2 [Cololabis saira]|uniref:uncharacterized protein LOC133448900 isoform X2 n=1 Tax=Cololabis saira TaxID=129043 RepID=UPI002AD53CB1|nr:uncharacterized protein LOC133448900 isoform X2 [Cololabis saira]
MSKVNPLREFLCQRLTAAAAEIFSVFEKTLLEFEEELDRKRRLLDLVLKPELRLHRVELPPENVCKVEEDGVFSDQHLDNLERSCSPDQEEPGNPQTPELEEDSGGQEMKHEDVEVDVSLVNPTDVKVENGEPGPNCGQLLLHTSPVAPNKDEEGTESLRSDSSKTADPEPMGRHGDHEDAAVPSDSNCESKLTRTRTGKKGSTEEMPPEDSGATQSSSCTVEDFKQVSTEEMPPEDSGATQSSSTIEDLEQMDTENQFCSPTEMDTVVNSEREQQSDQGSMSDDDQHMSVDENTPDSDSQDDEDSDASKPAIPDDGTSYGSDTSIRVVSSTSKGWPLLEDDKAPKTAAMSDSEASVKGSSKEEPDGVVDLHKQQSSHLTMSNKNYCYICGKPQSKIARHLQTHKTDAEIEHAFSFPEHSKERKMLLEKIRNKGNFRHNTAVLQSGKGSLKVKRTPKTKELAGKFIHCMYCQGMYIRKELWRHVRRCSCKPGDEDVNKEPGRTRVLGLAGASESTFSQQISSGVWKLLSARKQDEIASLVRNDLSIIQFAQSLYNRHGQDPTKYEYMRQKLREVGRLLLCLHTDYSVQNLEEAVRPANFHRVVQAVKKVAGFDEDKHSYRRPSLALKLGRALRKISDIIHCRALMAEDGELTKSTELFKKLLSSKWSALVSRSALNTLSDAKHNKPSTLPFTEDVQILHQYLQKSAESAFCSLKKEATTQNYGQLAKVTLAQIIVFNRRRDGEVSKMRLKGFHKRDNTKLHEDVAMGLSKTEQRLCNYFSPIEIKGEKGRKVAVLLTPGMVDALSLLVSKRTECDVCATNVFLFARPKSMSHYRGQDCLRIHASQCGAKQPEHLRSTQLRKHVATFSQVLHLKNNELDQVADFLGHDIRVHRDFYRLPVPTTQLAKISKLLISMEKGHLSTIQGKSLDEIEIEEKIALSEDEAEDSGSQSDDDGSDTASTMSECGTSEAVDAASNRTITEQVNDFGDFEGAVSSKVTQIAPPSEALTVCLQCIYIQGIKTW